MFPSCNALLFCLGCYRFSDGSYMAYREFGETGPKQTKINISAPIFTENRDCQIQETLLSRNGEEWEALEDETPFLLKNITSDTIELKVKTKDVPWLENTKICHFKYKINLLSYTPSNSIHS